MYIDSRFMALVDRLQRILTLTEMTPYDLSKRAGLSTSQVRQWIDRRSERVAADQLRKVAEAAGVSASWLITGLGSPEDVDELDARSPSDEPAPTPRATEGDDTPPSEDLPPGCLADSPTYGARKKTARRLAPDVPDDWVWDDLDTTDTLFLGTREPSPQVLADLARLIQKHGKPR